MQDQIPLLYNEIWGWGANPGLFELKIVRQPAETLLVMDRKTGKARETEVDQHTAYVWPENAPALGKFTVVMQVLDGRVRVSIGAADTDPVMFTICKH